MERICLDCGSRLTGRSDRKFCSDSCRINYHNTRRREEEKSIRLINHCLRKNRYLLSDLFQSDKTVISMKELLLKGFNPYFHTHSKNPGPGFSIQFFYDYGIRILDNDHVCIVRETL